LFCFAPQPEYDVVGARRRRRTRMPVSKNILDIALKRHVADEEENLRLWEAARAGDDGAVDPDAAGRALCANLIHIVRVAEEFADSGPLSPDDLVSEGCILLVTAYIPKYDVSRGASIRGFLRQALRRDFVKIVSRDGQPGMTMPMGRLTKIARKRKEGDEQAADALQRESAMAPVDGDSERPSPSLTPAEEAERGETLYRLRIAMSMLDERERDVVSARYAFPPFDGQETFEAIGRRWGVTKERARQIEGAALTKLRKALASLE